MRFEFASPARIIFGPGTAAQVGPLAREMGRRALVTTGLKATQSERLLAALTANSVDYVTLTVPGEPTTDLARQGARLALESGCDLVIGLGGGSAIDAGKAIAALAANGGDPLDYLEVVGRGQPLTKAVLALHRHPHHRRHRRRSHPQRRAGLARAQHQGQPAEPDDDAAPGDRGS